MKTILVVVEDNIDINNLIKEVLKNEQYRVISAYSGTEALMILEKENIDLILLDLMLPGLNGEEIIERVKNIPIIVISAKDSLEDKVNVLLNGANDYITKPFDSAELLARIKVQLRKEENKRVNDLTYKDLILKQDSQYEILKKLMLNPKKVITKTKLLEEISDETLDCDENALKVHISNLRKKIKTITPDQYIESVWGIGFKMYD